MLEPEQFERIRKSLPLLQRDDPELLRQFKAHAYYAEVPRGKDIFLVGDQVDAIAILMSGAVRVYRIGESGREITLYRFGEGESCILSATAILKNHIYPAIATVERDAEAIMVPSSQFREWMERYDLWRDFVFSLLSDRIVSMMEIVEEVAFQRMDRRLAGFLGEHSRQNNPIQITHQQIANDLGSSREVVSRLLQDFSEKGVVDLGRGEIDVLDPSALEDLQTM